MAGVSCVCLRWLVGVGPGRWGTTNADLGVFVSYADIYNAGALDIGIGQLRLALPWIFVEIVQV